jgi:hypothetical protein
LIHDRAVAIARATLDRVAQCIREGTHRDAFEGFHAVAKAGLEIYEPQADRMQERLAPTRN